MWHEIALAISGKLEARSKLWKTEFCLTPELENFIQERCPNFSNLNGHLTSIPLALIGALYQTLPGNSPYWSLNCHNYTVAHMAVRYTKLPSDFNQWELVDETGWTVAHAAAEYGHLPPHFKQWHLADETGWTVAHAAAEYGHLPPDFKKWYLADETGWTVAHEAAKRGHLPKHFQLWHLVDRRGRTVADIAIRYRHLSPGLSVEGS